MDTKINVVNLTEKKVNYTNKNSGSNKLKSMRNFFDKLLQGKVIDYLFKTLGEEKAKKVHIHFSKIEYGDKGEIRHLTMEDNKYGPEFEPLAKLLKEYNMEPVVICESSELMAHDALILKNIYDNVK